MGSEAVFENSLRLMAAIWASSPKIGLSGFGLESVGRKTFPSLPTPADADGRTGVDT